MENEMMVHDVVSGEISFRAYTDQEKLDRAKAKKEHDEQQAIILEMQNSKAVEKAALLAKLGITDDEAKLLLS
jgi:hypothetical protein